MTYNSLDEFIQALERAKLAIPNKLFPVAYTLTRSMKEDIKKRVSETGKSSLGGSFSPYSPKYAKKKLKKGSGALGKTTAFKNFYLTGTMWNGFDITNREITGDTIKLSIGFAGSNTYASNRELDEYHSDAEVSNKHGPMANPT